MFGRMLSGKTSFTDVVSVLFLSSFCFSFFYFLLPYGVFLELLCSILPSVVLCLYHFLFRFSLLGLLITNGMVIFLPRPVPKWISGTIIGIFLSVHSDIVIWFMYLLTF